LAQSGIRFTHNNGAFGKSGCLSHGPGCAFIDYDNDSYPDILLINGRIGPATPRAVRPRRSYHNNQNGTFTT
jgi:hypothetical protein